MVEQRGTVSAELCSLQGILSVQDTKYKKKVKYKNFLHEVGWSWISEVQDRNPILMTFNCQRSKQHQGDLNRTGHADSPVISEHTNLKKLLVVGREKGSTLQDSVKCVLRSETRYICKFCVVPLHKGSYFEKYHSVTNY